MDFPNQPTYTDMNGIVRFQVNPIVRFLLDDGSTDMNRLARMNFPDWARTQFAQLIGYSVDGYEELEYTLEYTWEYMPDYEDDLC